MQIEFYGEKCVVASPTDRRRDLPGKSCQVHMLCLLSQGGASLSACETEFSFWCNADAANAAGKSL